MPFPSYSFMDVSTRLYHDASKAGPSNLQGPGSFLEVRKILPLLTAVSPEQPSFNVVAMSLPGFAFSEGPKKKGFAAAQYAEVCCLLKVLFPVFLFLSQQGREQTDAGAWIQ